MLEESFEGGCWNTPIYATRGLKGRVPKHLLVDITKINKWRREAAAKTTREQRQICGC